MTKFLAVDVETANPDCSSICQIGIVTFENGKVSSTWETLINPEDYFAGENIAVHHITPEMVSKSPTYPRIAKQVSDLLFQQLVISHMAFDRVSIDQVTRKYKSVPVICDWLDSACVVRRAWKQFSSEGYALGKITRFLGIEFKHHDAAEDARAAGEVVLRAIQETDIPLSAWITEVTKPITVPVKPTAEGNPDGPLYGESIVFTGELSIPRRQATEMAAAIGCDVKANVSAKTSILVVGDQDIRKLVGHTKSSKHRKAEELIAEGHPIRIISESDFSYLVKISV